MIVRHFLDWVRTAPAGKRAEATSALARAYLYSDLSPDDAAAAEGAMLMLLDDPSPLVRRALADVLAASPSAPPAIVLALAADQPQIAAPVLALSPLFVDADLVDAVATGSAARAGRDREPLPACRARSPPRSPKSARPKSCLVLLENQRRRHCAVLDRPHRRALRPSRRHSRSAAGARTISGADAPDAGRQAVRRRWPISSPSAMARRGARAAHRARGLREGDRDARRGYAGDADARRLSGICAPAGSSPPVSSCARCCPATSLLFEEALAELTEMPVERVSGLVHDAAAPACARCSTRPGLPPSTYPAFKEAIEAMREGGFISEPGGAARLKRRMIERVLTRCEDEGAGEIGAAADAVAAFRRPKPRAKRRGCSATSSSRTPASDERSEAA